MRAEALLKRIASAVVFVPAFVWLLWSGPAWLFAALLAVLTGTAAWELARLFEQAGRPALPALNVAVAVAVSVSFCFPGAPRFVLTVAVLVVLSSALWRGGALSIEPTAVAVLAATYVGWLLGYAWLLYRLPSGPALVLFLVGVTWIGESIAYAVGSSVGRHRLAPVLSPRKTVEGAVAQLVGSVAAAVLLAVWLLPDWAPATAALVGGVLGVIGQVGDLAESAIKRTLGTKDTGTLIPGHGGVLDRLDSLLFNTPALFYLVVFLGGRT